MAKSTIRLADVARAAGVSQGTASNVFNRPELVRPEVREQVLATASSLGYSGPSLTGRLLRAGKVNAIGVAAVAPLAYFFSDPWARAILAAIAEVCDANGTGLALISAENRHKLDWNIKNALVDGFVLLCVEGGEKLVQLTRERDLPFIALALGVEDRSIPALGIDNIGGAYAAARHLCDLGHRRFAILATEFNDQHVGPIDPDEVPGALYSTTRERMQGYWRALAECGIDRAEVPIFETINDEQSVRAGLDHIFSLPQRPTALLAMSDAIAMIAMNWLRARGLSVPDDISVIGFDGVPEGAETEPGLTTIAQPFPEIARRAVQAVLGGEPISERQTLPLQLIVRASTAPPPP